MILTRTRFSGTGIFGELTQDDGSHVAYTLEHSYNDLPKLPDGTYTCVRGQHMLHSGAIETFEITHVPNCFGILFHPGNDESSSAGCVLLGTTIAGDCLMESRMAFNYFISLLVGINSFNLNVT